MLIYIAPYNNLMLALKNFTMGAGERRNLKIIANVRPKWYT